MNATYKGVFIGLGLALLGFGGYKTYEHYQYTQKETQKLKPLTSEEIFNKNQNAVVLIKHSFAYVIELFGEKYYFTGYNPITGEISRILSREEAEGTPQIAWGTGFFIKSNGSVLTNRHNVIVAPNKEESNNIIKATKSIFIAYLYELISQKEEIESALDNLERQRYYADYYSYEYDVLTERINELKQDRQDYITKINGLSNAIDNFETKTKVSKTSFQFGVYLNGQNPNKNLDDYIKYKSVKISDNEDVDLALLEPVNPVDILHKNFAVADMSKIDSVQILPLKTTQKVIMIGYNKGETLGNISGVIKPQITEGNISQNTDDYRMLYTIPALPGSSGSPIYDIYGRVIGVNFASFYGEQNFNWGIQPQQIKNFLNR